MNNIGTSTPKERTMSPQETISEKRQSIPPDEEMARVRDGIQSLAIGETDTQRNKSQVEVPNNEEGDRGGTQVNAEDMALNQQMVTHRGASTGNDIPEVNNSLTMYRMQSLLSQSTGQEREMPHSTSASQDGLEKVPQGGLQNSLEQSEHPAVESHVAHDGLPTEPKAPHATPTSEMHSNGSSQNTSLESASSSNLHSTKDSLIFQQSGLTLNNMIAPPSAKNLNLSQPHPGNMSRTASQQSLQRQESYLSFRAPDKWQSISKMSNIAMSSMNNEALKAKSKESNGDSTKWHSNKIDTLASAQTSKGNITENVNSKEESAAEANTSLLSQAKNQMETSAKKEKYQEVDLSKLDLSSYLSTQEPEPETRTQQKLWLQRENVASLNDSEEMDNGYTAHIVNQTSRFQYEQLSREFLQIRRYKNPILESLQRVDDAVLSNRKMDIDSKSSQDTSLLSTSIAKSIKQQYIPSSISNNFDFRSKETDALNEAQLQVNFDEINETLADLWKQNCVNFKEMNLMKKKQYELQKLQLQQQQQQQQQQHFQQQQLSQHNQPQCFDHYNGDMRNGALLSSRYGYQPNNGNSQLANIFSRGNRTSFGQSGNRSSSTGVNRVGNTNPQTAIGVSKYHPTTRAQQQQQQQQQQHQQYQQEQLYQQRQQQSQDLQPFREQQQQGQQQDREQHQRLQQPHMQQVPREQLQEQH